ncbi:MAG: UDP-N-acetylmuramate--L-alanine ligase [Candidatus Bostrichicola ureolyticus]|nr:MAG: UDP-N-acetylmuramate--L-alanine ligase [Candidatus Bostrichicola ureolyticus]
MKYFYFIGIGGIGMSALARYFNFMGKKVYGYDRVKTILTQKLEKEGININYNDRLELIPKEIKYYNSIIIYTPAINNNNKQLMFFKKNNFIIKKRSEILGQITKNNYCIAIAGTHGKTTISTLLGFMLDKLDYNLTAFLGGIAENYDSNIILKGNELSIVEADEFDYSFLQLSPNIICINSIDMDHIDIYKNIYCLKQAYLSFYKKLKNNGKIFVNKGILNNNFFISKENIITYSVEEKADYYSVYNKNYKNFFDFNTPKGVLEMLPLPMIGKYNLENITAALTILTQFDFEIEELRKILFSFKGVKRRFSIVYKSSKKIYIDDYAHHPKEIDVVVNTIRSDFKGKLLGVFQPHLFSRTKYLKNSFIKSLEKFDALILLNIYPARENPIKGISSYDLLKDINIKEKQICSLSNVLQAIKSIYFDILLTIGAGDIDTIVDSIKNWLSI